MKCRYCSYQFDPTKELEEGRRLHLLNNVLKDNGFSIDTTEERGDFTFMEGIKI